MTAPAMTAPAMMAPATITVALIAATIAPANTRRPIIATAAAPVPLPPIRPSPR